MLCRKRSPLGWLSLLAVTLSLLAPTGPVAAPVLRLPQDFLTLTAVMFPGDGLAGAPLAYVDNGDGTFTDLVTGWMWEKKVAGGGTCAVDLHAVGATCTWADATGAWIAAINAEGASV